MPIVRANVAKETAIVTDESSIYSDLKRTHHHAKVNHGEKEWVAGEFHTNTVEGYFSIFKRGMKGVYQHCSARSICTAILPSSISATRTASAGR